MQSSLDSGLSGMTSHQLMLDVVATNLANVSTPGFKGSQASFANALSQTDYAGAQPGDNLGGRNPEQIGLGVQTGAIEVNMKQGSLQETGRTLDLAVQGAGFFQVAKMNNGGAVIEPFYTRVGNFDFDKANTMVDLATGLKVVGLRTDLNGVTQGTAGAIDITDDRAMPAAATQNVTFQGNLSAADGALQGNSLTAGFPLMAVDPGNHSSVATEDTPLSTLTAFNTANGNRFTPPVPPALGDRTIYVFGTKPDGNAYAGNFTINPWTDSVGTLISRINTVLTQGSDNFGKVALDNGNLTATGLGDGQDFSLFLGESDPIAGVSAFVPTAAAVPGLTGVTASPATTAAYTVPTALAGALETTFTIPAGTTLAAPLVIATQVNGVTVNSLSIPAGTYAVATPFTLASFPNVKPNDQVQYQLSGPAVAGIAYTSTVHTLNETVGATYSGSGITEVVGGYTIQAGEAGLLQPSFVVPADSYGGVNGSLRITVRVNGVEVGSVEPTGTLAAPTTLSLSSYPHVKVGDVVTYELSGSKTLAAPITWSTNLVADSNSGNLTADINADGIPDMFQENGPIDIDAWQYEQATNSTMNWYQMRFTPESVISSIQVYDSNGGSHILSARLFRTGTSAVTNGATTDRSNSWDMLLNIQPEDGVLTDDLVTGIRFDKDGKYLGPATLGATVHGTSLSDGNTYVGTPADNDLRVNWATTGTAAIAMDLGKPNSTNGLTGFGSADTAAAINQDGNDDGALQTLSVSQNGNLIGLYSNGKSRPLYQIQLATFANPAGLNNVSTNLWQVSSNSGDPLVRQAGTANAGTISAGVLEGSNVDIASEFTKLIIAQRGFQVNARVIQTSDSMLQELAGLIR